MFLIIMLKRLAQQTPVPIESPTEKKIKISRFEPYPLQNPTSICVGFIANHEYFDTLVQRKEGENDEYYITTAITQLKSQLDAAFTRSKTQIGREIIFFSN